MMFHAESPHGPPISDGQLRTALWAAFEAIGERRRAVVVPPDITRRHSFAARITGPAVEYYRDRIVDVLPALGTHGAMTRGELALCSGVYRRNSSASTGGRTTSRPWAGSPRSSCISGRRAGCPSIGRRR